MGTEQKLRIAIDCRIANHQQGIGTAVLALADALSRSPDTTQDYTFIVSDAMAVWLKPHIFGPCRLHPVILAPALPAPAGLKHLISQIKPLRILWRKLKPPRIPIAVSDGYVESQKFDIVHFPTQTAYLTSLPSIYQPWDLQYIHYPKFFSEDECARRDARYRAYSNDATFVCVQTEWTRQDIIKQYGLSPDKVVVVRWGSVFASYEPPSPQAQDAARKKFALPEQFFFYPAVPWPHKNHEVIYRALHLLKQQQHIVHVYFTGADDKHHAKLDELARKLGISNQTHFLGFVSADELQSICQAATAMVFPSRFEGFGLPIFEAFQSGVPVLSSNASVLPEVGQDGALYFDPNAPAELTALMIRMLDDPKLRSIMIEKGKETLSKSSIRDTAANMQALYRRTASQGSKPAAIS